MNIEKTIKIKTVGEIETLRKSGKILASIIEEIKRSLKTGITTKDIDRKAEKLIAKNKAESAFRGYRGYPASVCASINEEVVHGIPSDGRVLNAGDIISIDIGIVVDGYFTDMAFTAGIGKIDRGLQKLISVTRESLKKGITQAAENKYLFDISHAVQSCAEANNFSVVRDFVGHGIGRELHEVPEIPNFGKPHTGPILKEGMVLAIEPMVNMGVWQTKVLDDGWTVVTLDGKPSAHFEHTVLVTRKGPEILTK